jgi:hypothetical protein
MIEPYSEQERIYVQKLVKKHKRKKFLKMFLVGGIIGILLIVSVFIVVSSNILVPTDTPNDFAFDRFGWSKSSIILTSEEYIKPQLRFPSSAQFSNEIVTLEQEEVNFNKYLVTGSVESLNSFGIKLKQSFSMYLLCYAYGQYDIVDFTLS